MGGYAWKPKFRILTLPSTSTYWEPFVDMTGVKGQTETDGPTYKEERIQLETVDYKRMDRILGWRVTFGFTFFVDGTMADHSGLATLVSALQNQGKEVYLDPNPAVTSHSEKRVRLGKYSMKPVAGKTFAGAEFYLEVFTQDLITSIPAIGSGLAW